MRVARVPASEYFANEIEEAERIGCRFELRIAKVTAEHSESAFARLIPVNPRTRGAFRTAAARSGHLGNDAIETRQDFDPSAEHPVTAMASAIRSALDVAHAALASIDG